VANSQAKWLASASVEVCSADTRSGKRLKISALVLPGLENNSQ
jgi:hypothetical protein